MESTNDPEANDVSLLESTEVGSLNAVYSTYFNAGIGFVRAPWSSECTTQESLLWTLLILGLATLLLLTKRRFTTKYRKSLLPTPPGCNGYPLIGETYRFIYLEDTAEFVRRRAKQYGKIFYSRILGRPHLMVHTPEFVRYMLVDSHQHLTADAPHFVQRLFRTGSVISMEGQVHTDMFTLTAKSLSTKYHEEWTAGFSDVMRTAVDSWKDRTINCHVHSQKMFINTGFLYTFGAVSTDEKLRERTAKDVQDIRKALVGIPVNIPGTAYGRGMNARRSLDQLMDRQIQRFLKMKEEGVKPEFYSVMEFFLDKFQLTGKGQNSEECIKPICDHLSTFLVSQYEILAQTFTWVMKFLSEYPDVLRQVKTEQDAIRSCREGPEYRLTGEDLSKMTYSTQVIYEVMRVASVVGTVLRTVGTDFEYQGFSIPKGWTLHAGLRSIHLNPDYFPNPTKFDPSRFQDPSNITPGTFLPFGFGNRSCLGKTIVKKQLLVALHYVSTRIRWTALDPAPQVAYNPVAHIKGGYPIHVHSC